MKFDLVMDHSSLVVGPIGIPGIHRVSKSFQGPIHPPGKVKVNATDCCPTVIQSSGFSDFSVFCLVKRHRDSD